MLSSSCERNVEYGNFLTWKHSVLYSLAARALRIFSLNKEKENYIRKHPMCFRNEHFRGGMDSLGVYVTQYLQ